MIFEFLPHFSEIQKYPTKWSFGPEGSDEINLCMTIFGLMFFASLVISPIPGLLIGAISKKTGSDIKDGYFKKSNKNTSHTV